MATFSNNTIPLTSLYPLQEQMPDYMKTFLTFAFNHHLPIWPSNHFFKLLNALINWQIIHFFIFQRASQIPRILYHIQIELRRYKRRVIIGKFLQAHRACRELMINNLWVEMQKRAYLDDTGGFLSKYRAQLYRWIHHYEIIALQQLASAKNKTFKLEVLAFVDASRFGSVKTPSLKTAWLCDHLANVLCDWDHVQAHADPEKPGSWELLVEEEGFAEELHLIRQGESLRKTFIEDLGKPSFWHPRIDFGNESEDAWLGGDNLEFADYGPSIERLRKLVKCTQVGNGGSVYPRLEHAALWFSLSYTTILILRMLLLVYLAFRGYYYVTWDQVVEWSDSVCH